MIVKTKVFHLDYIKRCMVRVVYYQGSIDKTYVGCPLYLATEPELYRKHFPHAKFVFCVRDPVQNFPSFIDLSAGFTKTTHYSDEFTERIKCAFNINTPLYYDGMSRFEDDNTVWLDFENWKTAGP